MKVTRRGIDEYEAELSAVRLSPKYVSGERPMKYMFVIIRAGIDLSPWDGFVSPANYGLIPL